MLYIIYIIYVHEAGTKTPDSSTGWLVDWNLKSILFKDHLFYPKLMVVGFAFQGIHIDHIDDTLQVHSPI